MKIRGAILERIDAPRRYSESRPLIVTDLALLPPGDTELLVRIEAAGLCHSDLSVVDGNRIRPVPMLLGHEAAGIVEQVGAAVSDVAVGQRIVMTFLPRCGDCAACATDGLVPCVPGSAANAAGMLLSGGTRLSRNGTAVLHHLGVSAFATYAVVDRRSIVLVDAFPSVVVSDAPSVEEQTTPRRVRARTGRPTARRDRRPRRLAAGSELLEFSRTPSTPCRRTRCVRHPFLALR